MPAGSAGRTWGCTGQAWSRCHLNSRLFPPVRGSRPPARPLGAPPHRDSRPMLPAAGKAASFVTPRRRTGQRRRPRRPQLARQGAGLRGKSSYLGGGHPRAANENRTCWRPQQKEGESGPEAAISPQRPLSAGGRAEIRDLGEGFPAVPSKSVRFSAVENGALALQALGRSFMQGPPRRHMHSVPLNLT